MPEADVKLTAKHIAILRSFNDLGGHFRFARKNCRCYVWGEHTQTVFLDIAHICYPAQSSYRDLQYEPEWADLLRWDLIRLAKPGYPIYELTEKANIYLA